MFFAADDADGVEAVAGAGRRGRIYVIRPRAAEGQQGVLPLFCCCNEVVLELAPLVATDGVIDKVFALYPQLDAGAAKQAGFELL